MSLKPSKYQKLTLYNNKNSKSVDIRGGTVSINYYESILSPAITAKIRVINTGNTMRDDAKKQYLSIYNGLPLRGGELLEMDVLDLGINKSGIKLDLTVSSITEMINEDEKESFLLNLTSGAAISNELNRVYKKYNGTIDNSVDNILTNVLGVNRSKSNIEATQNKYTFIGNLKKPFRVLTWLASKAVPTGANSATAGFFFFETQDGFNFVSVDSLLKQDPVQKYVFTQITESSETFKPTPDLPSLDYKIIKYTVDRNQDLVKKLRFGTYSSDRYFFDPTNFQVSYKKFTSEDKTNLGSENIIDNLPEGIIDQPSRIFSQVLDKGTLEANVSKDPNADPQLYASQTVSRYNTLFTQSINIMIPCNTNLRAGDIIECIFPKTSIDSNETDDKISGKYLIKDLCHSFNPNNSTTSLNLVRDTYGKYGT
tara:strand:+ start:3875 stop:5152 length:1278 start_codon:yes stop_codon:yes gene_type:complete